MRQVDGDDPTANLREFDELRYECVVDRLVYVDSLPRKTNVNWVVDVMSDAATYLDSAAALTRVEECT